MNPLHAWLLLILGLLLALTAHLVGKEAERRARETYDQLLRSEWQRSIPQDAWTAVRPIVGRWGGFVVLLNLVRGLALVMALVGGLYLLL
ncbi:MAG: hypothetical protein ACLFU8_13945 [Anaerolineales bacterium]